MAGLRLMRAVYGNKRDAVITLLESERVDLEARDDRGATALHVAVERGHRDLVSALIEHGADAGSTDDAGRDLLHKAEAQGFRRNRVDAAATFRTIARPAWNDGRCGDVSVGCRSDAPRMPISLGPEHSPRIPQDFPMPSSSTDRPAGRPPRRLKIRNAAVIGSGTMGSGIAGHLANAGVDVLLLDVASDTPDRNAVAGAALERMRVQKSPAVHAPGTMLRASRRGTSRTTSTARATATGSWRRSSSAST